MKSALAGFALSLILSGVAQAGWIQAESENFILTGDLREGDAEDLLQELESFRVNILGLVGTEAQPEVVKLPITTVKNDKTLRRVYHTERVGGVYRMETHGPAYLMMTKKGFGRNSFARTVALHEYSHHLLAAFTDARYPRWYNEGFAEMVASYEHKKDAFTIGQPHQRHGGFLEYVDWYDPETMLRTVSHYPFQIGGANRNAQGQFYAQSWLWVHYIQNTEGLAPRFMRYVEALNAGGDPVESFEPAMGMSPNDFAQRVKRYHAANRFRSVTFRTPIDKKAIPVTITELPKAMGDLAVARTALHFARNDEDLDRVAEQIATARAALGETADVLGLEADLALRRRDMETARTRITKALELAPDRLEWLRLAGQIELADGQGAKARDHLERALAFDPDDPGSNYHMAMAWVETHGSNVPKDALPAVRAALSYFRNPSYAERNLPLASVMVAKGRGAEVADVLRDASVWAQTPSLRRYAKTLLERV